MSDPEPTVLPPEAFGTEDSKGVTVCLGDMVIYRPAAHVRLTDDARKRGMVALVTDVFADGIISCSVFGRPGTGPWGAAFVRSANDPNPEAAATWTAVP